MDTVQCIQIGVRLAATPGMSFAQSVTMFGDKVTRANHYLIEIFTASHHYVAEMYDSDNPAVRVNIRTYDKKIAITKYDCGTGRYLTPIFLEGRDIRMADVHAWMEKRRHVGYHTYKSNCKRFVYAFLMEFGVVPPVTYDTFCQRVEDEYATGVRVQVSSPFRICFADIKWLNRIGHYQMYSRFLATIDFAGLTRGFVNQDIPFSPSKYSVNALQGGPFGQSSMNTDYFNALFAPLRKRHLTKVAREAIVKEIEEAAMAIAAAITKVDPARIAISRTVYENLRAMYHPGSAPFNDSDFWFSTRAECEACMEGVVKFLRDFHSTKFSFHEQTRLGLYLPCNDRSISAAVAAIAYTDEAAKHPVAYVEYMYARSLALSNLE